VAMHQIFSLANRFQLNPQNISTHFPKHTTKMPAPNPGYIRALKRQISRFYVIDTVPRVAIRGMASSAKHLASLSAALSEKKARREMLRECEVLEWAIKEYEEIIETRMELIGWAMEEKREKESEEKKKKSSVGGAEDFEGDGWFEVVGK